MAQAHFGVWKVELPKRLTKTEKWDDPWFWGLSPSAKLLWLFLCDHCDNAGVVELSLKFASLKIGQPIKEKHLSELGNRVQQLSNGKLWLTKFVAFQFGVLTPSSAVHRSVISLIKSHNLTTHTLSHDNGIAVGCTSPKDKVQEKDKEKEGVQGEPNGHYHKDSRVAIYWLNEKSGRHFRETHTNLSTISERLREPGVDIAGVKAMIERQCKRWGGTQMAEFLRPETLFGKKKFDGYYAAKDLPVESQYETGCTGRKTLVDQIIQDILP